MWLQRSGTAVASGEEEGCGTSFVGRGLIVTKKKKFIKERSILASTITVR